MVRLEKRMARLEKRMARREKRIARRGKLVCGGERGHCREVRDESGGGGGLWREEGAGCFVPDAATDESVVCR